jgi:CheY-like chemotaxis protein
MPPQFDYRMLIVDDDAVFCEVADELFSSRGYTVRCADDGFEALEMMKWAMPDIIICDLNLPRMSGFEFLSIVRRRFPQIPVVAISGDYVTDEVQRHMVADAFLQKGGEHTTQDLLSTIQGLLQRSPLRSNIVKSPDAPTWVPLNGRPYFILTCTNCLRSFSLPQTQNGRDRVEQSARCEFCGTEVKYVLDSQSVGQAR